jgi:glycogen(starch) synthase
MRVLGIGSMYPPHYLGGHELVWRAANAELRAAGHDVRSLASDYRLPAIEPGAEDEPAVHRELRWYWRDHDFPRTSLRERVALERADAATLARHLGDFRPDAVCWWSLGGMSLALVEQVRRAGVPAVGVVGDHWMSYGFEVDAWMRLFHNRAGPLLAPLAERLTGVPARVELGRAARWAFISEHVRAAALRRWELPDTLVAHPGVDLDRFRPADPQPWRWRLAYVGRIDPRKGIALAVRALLELPEEATLAVVGAGDDVHLAELRELAAELGVGERVRFSRARHEELPGVYAAADAIVFPALWQEPWGLVPLESMAVGRPVVARIGGGAAEYLRDGDNCVEFDPEGGAEALAEALRALARDERLRERLREHGLATARRFPEGALARTVREALEDVAR